MFGRVAERVIDTSDRTGHALPTVSGTIVLTLPDWFYDHLEGYPDPLDSPEARMDLVLSLAQRNVDEGSGGPFGAAVFDIQGGLIAAGVNLVVPASAPIAHAEIVAIAHAGQTLGSWQIGQAGGYELTSSTEPCAMCLGAVPWSGVKRLVCGASDSDARAVGFDEGHKPADWVEHLISIGIEVQRDVRRIEAAAVLQSYASDGGAIYNGLGSEGQSSEGQSGEGQSSERGPTDA